MTYIDTVPACTLGPVEEVLSQAKAPVESKLGRSAREHAARAITGVGVVALVVSAHQGPTLLIPTRTLATRTVHSIATVGARFCPPILGTVRGRAVARLLGIAGALTRPADGSGRGQLAIPAAVLVAVVADGVVLEPTRGCVAAGVVAARAGPAAVAVLAFFDDAVAAHGVADGGDAAVVGETAGVDRVALQGGADVADGAGRESSDALCGGGVHEVLGAGIALGAAQRAALLRVDRVWVGAGGVCAVVDGAVRVARLVGDDLPLGQGADDDVGAGDVLAGAAAVLLRALHTGLSEPGEADGGVRVAGREQGPVRVRVGLLAAPAGEEVEAGLDVDAVAARLVPGRGLLRGGRAVRVGDDDVGQPQRDLEGALEQLRGQVHLLDDVLLRAVPVPVEGLDVRAVGSHADERNLPRRRTALRAANRADQVDARPAAARLVVHLPPKQPLNRHRRTARRVARAHARIHRVVGLRVEPQPVALARLPLDARPLPQLGVVLVRGHAHVAVAEHHHALLPAQLHVRVLGPPGGLVAAGQLDVVVVVVQRKGALEQRLQPIPPYPDARPADLVPATPPLRPRGPLEHLVLPPVNQLLPMHAAVGGEVRDAPAVDKDVVVGLEAEADALRADIKRDVKRGHGRYPVVGSEDVCILGVLYRPQRRAVR